MKNNVVSDFIYKLRYRRVNLRTRLLLLIFANSYKKYLSAFQYAFADKIGLEIGGPTLFFSEQLFPVYELASRIDGCNFRNDTLWGDSTNAKQYEYFPNKFGNQYIMEGADLSNIDDNSYDFLLSSHNLEHIANPLKAVREWLRVVKNGGFLLLVLPDKRFMFDRKRPYTTFEHILADEQSNVGEQDLTHLNEILLLHDLRLDHEAGREFSKFKERCENNFEFRGMHHHVFSQALLKTLLTYVELKIVFQYNIPPYHQIILAQKIG